MSPYLDIYHNTGQDLSLCFDKRALDTPQRYKWHFRPKKEIENKGHYDNHVDASWIGGSGILNMASL